MENKKVKELKDDVILDIKVNKSYYMMAKAALFTLLNDVYSKEKGKPEEFIQSILKRKYEELNDKERAFYTLTLLIGEIEKQALENDAFEEKEIDVEKLKANLKKSEESNED